MMAEYENRHGKGDLEQMQSLPLRIKITMTERRIHDWWDYYQGDVYLSFSGGKDSTVLKHIIDNMGLGIPSVFINTGLEYPEIQKFAMTQDNVTTVRPRMRFDEVIKKYGYPVVSKEVSKKIQEARAKPNGVSYEKLFGTFVDKKTGQLSQYNCDAWSRMYDAPFKISDKCCWVMKKTPAHKYEKETGRKPIIAVMADESRQRKANWLTYGCNAFNMGRPQSRPMAFWTEQDVLHYLKQYDVPYCSVYGDIVAQEPKDTPVGQMSFSDLTGKYDEKEVLKTTGVKRTGCMFCMFGCHLEKEPNRFQKMKETHPRQYEYCIGGGEMVNGFWEPTKEGLGLGYVLDRLGIQY